MVGEEVILVRDLPNIMPVELLLFGVTMTATVMPVNLIPKTTLYPSHFRFLKCGLYSYSDQSTTWGQMFKHTLTFTRVGNQKCEATCEHSYAGL